MRWSKADETERGDSDARGVRSVTARSNRGTRSVSLSNLRGWLIALCVACAANAVACADHSPADALSPLPAPSGGAGGDAGISVSARPGAVAGDAEHAPSGDLAVARADAGGGALRNEGAAANEAAASAGDGPGASLEPEPDGGRLEIEPQPSEAPDVAISFATDLHPIFARRCGPCHITQRIAGHNVGGALPGAYNDALALGQTLLERIDGGSMPPTCDGAPGSAGCLSIAEVELVRRWLDQSSPP